MIIPKILIVEDDMPFALMLQGWFGRNGFSPVLASKIEQAKAEILEHQFDLLLTDLRLPDGDGIMLLDWIREQKKQLPVMVMTSYAEIQSAVAAIKLGAEDFLEKPINPTILKSKITQLLERDALKTKKTVSQQLEISSNLVVNHSRPAKQMYEHIDIVAPTKMSVLICGESGTGKEYVAHMIHEKSNRNKFPFIAVDCGVLSRELAPSELFGHLKGSFTSAMSDKKGVFEQANGGTVFLDEIGNLSYEVQVQLLRTLQEQRVRAVGAVNDLSIDVRVIAATNEKLEEGIEKGSFREDLFHRLNEFSLTVPPLRERKEDIVAFVDYFLKEANIELGREVKKISKEALMMFKQHSWSGNLRELRNVVRRAVLFSKTDEISIENLPVFSSSQMESGDDVSLQRKDERWRIELALKKSGGNKSLAAKLLEIDRKTLYNKMHQYGIKI